MKIIINFTLFGFFLFTGDLLITFIGINVGSVPLILMSSFIYGLFIFSFLELIFQPFLLKLEFIVPPLVEENKEEVVFVKVKNDFPFEKGKFFIFFKGRFIPCNIGGREEKYFNFTYLFKKRGVEEFNDVWIKFTGTFGLFYIKKHFPINVKTLVYPTYYQIHRELAIPGDSGYKTSISSFTRFGEEIHTLRKYTPGDPLRIIAWKASAKKGELISKQFEKLSILEAIFLLDNCLSSEIDNISLEEFDQLLRFLHSIVLSFLRQGLKVKIQTLYPKEIFMPQNWDDLKIFLAKLEIKRMRDKSLNLDENFSLVFSLDYSFWESKSHLQKKFIGVEFHRKDVESSLYVFKREENPYDFLNLWSIHYE